MLLAATGLACDRPGAEQADALRAPAAEGSVAARVDEVATAEGSGIERPMSPAQPSSVRLTDGLVTIEPIRCHIDGIELVGDSPLDVIGRFEFVADRLYVVDRTGRLLRFVADLSQGCLLRLDTDWADRGVMSFDGEIAELSGLDDGRLYASTGVFGSFFVGANGAPGTRCDTFDQGRVAMAPDGTWGVGHFVSDELRRVTWVDGVCAVDDLVFDNPFHMVSAVRVTNDRMYVGGTISERVDVDRPHQLVAYDHGGQKLWTAGNGDDPFAADGYGYFHAIEPCGDAICVVDSNLRRLHVVSPDGVQRAVFDLGLLLGLEWPWVTDLEALPDGSALISGVQERAGGGEFEALVYRLEYR